MSAEKNKVIVRKFFDAFVSGRNDEMSAFLTDDATWWANGKGPSGGTLDKAAWFEQTKRLFSQAKSPLKFEFVSVTAEDDRVSVEGKSRVEFEKKGVIYENEYHFMIKVRGGKICSVREYMDTEYVARVLPLLA